MVQQNYSNNKYNVSDFRKTVIYELIEYFRKVLTK